MGEASLGVYGVATLTDKLTKTEFTHTHTHTHAHAHTHTNVAIEKVTLWIT